jgi:ABC-type uncharacterized transport system permease subunit
MIDFLAAAVRIATPLLLAALGGILSERAGVFAVGLEGMMLMGAFAAALGAWTTDSSLVGIALALVGGASVGLVVSIVTVRYRADDMVTGLTANILAAGLTSYLLTLFLSRTQAGLTLRATGENPEAVFASGVEPLSVRMLAVIACGAIAGLGGAVLSLQQVGTFTDGMTGGRGYLALVVARWNPLVAALACLIDPIAAADRSTPAFATIGRAQRVRSAQSDRAPFARYRN